jgi:hypothetical protein
MSRSSRTKRWIVAIAVLIIAIAAGSIFVASRLFRRLEPSVREQAIAYLESRFNGTVEIGRLRLMLPRIPPLRVLFAGARGEMAHVVVDNVTVRAKDRPDLPPLFTAKTIRFQVDLGRLFDAEKRIQRVELDEMVLRIPPKAERPTLTQANGAEASSRPGVSIGELRFQNSRILILPKSHDRQPLEFALHRVTLRSVGAGRPLSYEAEITNAKPSGMIHAHGAFGPWNAAVPGDSALSGDYTFDGAKLDVFPAIAGTLHSKGHFEGTLDAIEANGEASVAGFRLRAAGHSVPLTTRFSALVDGTSGNTVLKPVHVWLLSTAFTTSGAVLKHDGDTRRSIDLDVVMKDGDIGDLLRLTVTQKPFIAGRIQMSSRILIPPAAGRVSERLKLAGRFQIRRGQFLNDAVQDKVDTLSRRGQGQPGNDAISDVFSDLDGQFQLSDQTITFSTLTFQVPGSKVELAGAYDMTTDVMDFHGTLRLEAKVSETMRGWKHWLLKPVDPLFAKHGAGTYLNISITGPAKQPKFSASR